MALLIVDLDKHIGDASAWRDTFAAHLPDLEVRIWPEAGKLADIEYLAFMHPDFDALPAFPNLKAMFSRSAGVEFFVRPSQAAEGTAVQGRAAGRRSDDDRIRRHACASFSSRHARISGGTGQARVAPRDDRSARATTCRLPRFRHDGEGAGARVEVARVQGFRLGAQPEGGKPTFRSFTARINLSRFFGRPTSPSACCR